MAKGGPDLKRYMDKTLSLKLNGNRTVKVKITLFIYFSDIIAFIRAHRRGLLVAADYFAAEHGCCC